MNLLKAGAVVLQTVRRNSPIIVGAAASVGLLLIYYLTIKETEEIAEEMNEMPEEEIHSFKMVKKIVKTFAPSFILLVITLFCIVQSTVISQHRIRDLTTYSAGLAAYYQQYRNKNVKLNGAEKDHEIVREIVKDRIQNDPAADNHYEECLCLMAGYSHYFYVPSVTNIFEAFREIDIQLDCGKEWETLQKWMILAKAVEYDQNGNIVPFDSKYCNYGWSTYDLTSNEGVSMVYPYVGKEEDNGQEYYFIDVPMPKPLEPEMYKF